MPPTSLEPVSRTTFRDQLVARMLAAIFSGHWQSNQRLVETTLGSELGVSRTPIREALSTLAGLGMVELRPNHGAIVRPWNPDRLVEIYDLRRLLETEAARLAATRIDPALLKDLTQRTTTLLNADRKGPAWVDAWFSLDRLTHEKISLAAGHERLREELARYRVLVDSIRQTVGATREVRIQALRDHLEILKALTRQDPDRAATAMDAHIRSAAAEARDLF
jgi:DNA-binding GntR family transcriptional regulator